MDGRLVIGYSAALRFYVLVIIGLLKSERDDRAVMRESSAADVFEWSLAALSCGYYCYYCNYPLGDTAIVGMGAMAGSQWSASSLWWLVGWLGISYRVY